MLYLFIGEDSLSKALKIKAIRQEALNKKIEQFNLDILYAKELALADLQEKLLYFALNSPQRLVIIKDAQELKEDIKGFILQYAKKLPKNIILILDINHVGKSDEFINGLYRSAKVFRFREVKQFDTFALGRWITLRRPAHALRVLNQLIKDGERPERILGGLRYICERDTAGSLEMRKKLKLLLHCDIDIKTGRLKPIFALEKLIISLCGPKFFH